MVYYDGLLLFVCFPLSIFLFLRGSFAIIFARLCILVTLFRSHLYSPISANVILSILYQMYNRQLGGFFDLAKTLRTHSTVCPMIQIP